MATHNTHIDEPIVGKTYYGNYRNLRLLKYYSATGWCVCEYAFKTNAILNWSYYKNKIIMITVGDLLTYYQ